MCSPSSTARELTDALYHTLAIAEFSSDGVLLDANANYVSLFGCEREAMIGRHHSSFCSPAYRTSREYAELWDTLSRGQPLLDVICERRRRDGTTCWLGANFMPIMDHRHQVRRIVKVAIDITARHQQRVIERKQVQQLSNAADATDSAVVIVDCDWSIQYINAGFHRMFGWGADEVAGRSPIALLAPQMSDAFIEQFRSELKAGAVVRREEIVVGKSGQRLWVNAVTNPILDDDGSMVNAISVLTDITHIKMYEVLQQRALEAMAADEPLTQVLEMLCLEVERILPDVTASVLAVDEQGMLRSVAAPSLPLEYSGFVDGLKIGPKAGSCGTAAYRGEAVWVGDIATDPLWEDWRHLVIPMGYVACWSIPIQSNEGRVIGTFAFYYREVSKPDSFQQQVVTACVHLCVVALERERARVRIHQLAFYDSLTGLPNRRLLYEKAAQLIGVASREKQTLAVLFANLDRFRQVNDSLGHAAANELLCQMAERMKAWLSPRDLIGRLSDGGFVAVLLGCTGERLIARVSALQDALARPCPLTEVCVPPSTTIGISTFPADGIDIGILVDRAGMAVSQARATGRGQYAFFNDQLNQLAQEKLALEVALREALRTSSLCLHYQPQIDIGSRRLYGVEALARWFHPELGIVPADRFVPLAQECGLIDDLGLWVLYEACRQLREWRNKGLTIPAVSINLSPTSFHDIELPRVIARVLADHALAPHDLTVEITEGVLLDTNQDCLKIIDEVTALGVKLSMDDFGTGYSSLSYLHRLPASEIKLDRSFVKDLEHSEAARALSATITGIGHSLGLTVVAEGVETEAQFEILKEQGYSVAQGYLFSTPLSPDDLACWLAEFVGGTAFR